MNPRGRIFPRRAVWRGIVSVEGGLGRSLHGKIEIGVGIGFIAQGEVPPLLVVILEPVLVHQRLEQEPVDALWPPQLQVALAA